jgi:hypothetical protein
MVEPMDRVIQIKKEINSLEIQIEKLKNELLFIQKNCAHDFIQKNYTLECKKCRIIESLTW